IRSGVSEAGAWGARYFDVVTGDALSFDAPFINFCLAHRKHAVVVVKGEHRLLLQDAPGAFVQKPPQVWQDGRRTVRCWDGEGSTTAEGVKQPLRVVRTVETERRRERVAGEWREKEVGSGWYWATTLSKRQLSTRGCGRRATAAGTWRTTASTRCRCTG